MKKIFLPIFDDVEWSQEDINVDNLNNLLSKIEPYNYIYKFRYIRKLYIHYKDVIEDYKELDKFNKEKSVITLLSDYQKRINNIVNSCNMDSIIVSSTHLSTYYTLKSLNSNNKKIFVICFDAHSDTCSAIKPAWKGNIFSKLLKENIIDGLIIVSGNRLKKTKDKRILVLKYSSRSINKVKDYLYNNEAEELYFSFDIDVLNGYYFINSKYIGNVKSCNISGKFRLRTYSDAKFLEFKYKENDLRKKIRVKIENLDIYELLVKVDNSSDFIKILKKINFPIIPNEQSMKFKYVEIDYIREAFECIYDDNIARITFDYNIISSGQIINKDTCIFEIKGENFKKIEELLRCIIKDKETKFSKYKIAKKQCGTYHNPFYDLLENMSKSKFFYNYMKYNMNYYLIEKTKEYNELYKKIQFLLYRQIYLKQLFYDILHNIPIESKKYMIGIKGYFIEQYYDVPRLYGDIDFIAIQGKAYDVIKTFIDMGYSVKKYKYTPFYNNYVFLKILKDEYLKILHSFELQKSFSICNENINIEIDLQNKIYPTEKNFNKKTTIEKYRYNCGFLELDFLDYFLYLVNHIMQHLLFITPSEKNLQINLQKLYDLYVIVEKNTSKYNEKKLILAAKSKKMIPHLLYVLNIYTKVFYNSNVKFNIDNILLHYNRNQCEWANILDVSFDMDVSDIILGDFSKTKMYKLNEFLDLNSSIKNQSLYEFKCRILLNKLNKKGLI